MKGYLSVLTRNSPGVFMKISSLLYKSGLEMENLTFGQDSSVVCFRFNIAVTTGRVNSYQVVNQLKKLVEVIDVKEAEKDCLVEQCMINLKVRKTMQNGPRLFLIADLFNARVVHHDQETTTFELMGDSVETGACLGALKSFEIVELSVFNVDEIVKGDFKCNRKSSLQITV